MPIARQ